MPCHLKGTGQQQDNKKGNKIITIGPYKTFHSSTFIITIGIVTNKKEILHLRPLAFDDPPFVYGLFWLFVKA